MRKITSIILFLMLSILLFSESAVLRNISGKVEVSNNGSRVWRKATDGMPVELSDTISTGFGAAATLDLGHSKIALKPLTRMSVDMFIETKNKVSTSLFLQVGSVKAVVDSSSGIKQSFQVQSPFSTASVRGTIFEFDGRKLSVSEGTVALFVGKPKRIIQKHIMKEQKDKETPDDVLDEAAFLEAVEQEIEQQQPEVDDSKAIFVNEGESVEVVIPLTPAKKDDDKEDEEVDKSSDDETKAEEPEATVLTESDIIASRSVVSADTSVLSTDPTVGDDSEPETPEVYIPEVKKPSQTDITIIWNE